MINYTCSNCHRPLASEEQFAGKYDQCPVCQTKNFVPNSVASRWHAFKKARPKFAADVKNALRLLGLMLLLPAIVFIVITEAERSGPSSKTQFTLPQPMKIELPNIQPTIKMPTITVPNIGLGASPSASKTNMLTIHNGTDETALVRIKDHGTDVVKFEMLLAPRESKSHDIAPGKYTDVVRFGNNPKDYTYSKGEGFAIDPRPDEVLRTTLTLHRVQSGNYQSRQASKKEFD